MTDSSCQTAADAIDRASDLMDDIPAPAGDASAAQTSAPELERIAPTIGLEEAAKLLRCHPDSVRKMATAGKLPCTKVGRAWVFHTESLLRWLEGQCKSHQRLEQGLMDPGIALAEQLRVERERRMRARLENTRSVWNFSTYPRTDDAGIAVAVYAGDAQYARIRPFPVARSDAVFRERSDQPDRPRQIRRDAASDRRSRRRR